MVTLLTRMATFLSLVLSSIFDFRTSASSLVVREAKSYLICRTCTLKSFLIAWETFTLSILLLLMKIMLKPALANSKHRALPIASVPLVTRTQLSP